MYKKRLNESASFQSNNMWIIFGALLSAFIDQSNASGSNSSLLESKVLTRNEDPRRICHILTNNEFDFVVSIGEINKAVEEKFIHQFFGTMITPRYGFTYINKRTLEWVRQYQSYVNDMRRPFTLDELKLISRYISLRDFISDKPEKCWKISVGIAVIELAENVRPFSQPLISPVFEAKVTHMVGYNMLQGTVFPPPDESFVKIDAARLDESNIPRRYDNVDLWVKTMTVDTAVQKDDTGSLVFYKNNIVGIIMDGYEGYGMVQWISSDDISRAKDRCKKIK